MPASARIQFAWAIIARGLAGIILAMLAFGMPVVTAAVLGTVVGAYALVDGTAAVAAATRAHGSDLHSSPFVVEGVLGVIVGGAALLAADAASAFLPPLVAGWSIAAGVFRIAGGVHVHRQTHEWLLVLSGALGVALGLVVLQYPEAGPDSIMSALGAYAAVVGIMLGTCGIRLRRGASPVPA
jgi:uncharacterized membrane protein HdeD (DUF308 family)